MRSIRGKMLITLLLTAAISTILVSFFILNDTQRTSYLVVKSSNLAEIRNVRDYYFEKLITDMETLVQYWSKESTLMNYEADPAQGHITRTIPGNFISTYKKWLSVTESSGDITWMFFGLEKDGSIFIAPTDSTMPQTYDCRLREWYITAKKEPLAIQWSEPYVDAGDSGKMLQTVSKAVLREGVVVGVMAIDIEVQRFNAILQKLKFDAESQLYIVNTLGLPVATTEVNPGNVMERFTLDSLKEEQSLIRRINGSEYVVSIMPLSTNKWVLVGARPLEVEATLNASKVRIFWAALIQIIITLFIGIIISAKLFEPLEKLLGVIDDVTKGDIKKRTEINTRDEFGSLSRGFDTMLDTIEELFYERDHHLKMLKIKNREIIQGKEEIIAYSSQVEAMNDELSRLLNELGDNYLTTVKALANAIEASDDYTRGHCERVGDISKLLAEHMELTYENTQDLVYACVLHDIGKIAISDKILNKRTSLSKDELSMIKMHPLIGYEIIKDVHFLERPSRILLQHHERIDGLGYPYGLKGDAICLEAKILSVADAYDAMTSARAYRQTPLSKDAVVEELIKGRNVQFDSDVVDALLELIEDADKEL